MAAAAILDFHKLEISTDDPLQGGKCALTCKILAKSVKQLQSYGDITGFEMAAACHLGFVKLIFLRSERLKDAFCISVPNFVKIGPTVAKVS